MKAALFLILALFVVPAHAADEPLLDGLRSAFKTRAFSVGALLQNVGDFQGRRTASGQNGFTISNARLSIKGELDQGFDYFLQGNFINAAPLLDARVSYRTPYGFTLDTGLFKTRFGGEFLIPARSIDFVDRSLPMSTFGTGRSAGVNLRGKAVSTDWSAGVYNGTGPSANGNDDGDLLGVGRLSWKNEAAGLSGGISAAYGRDRSVSYGSLLTGFHGRRALAGADARWRTGDWMVAAEGIVASLQPAGAGRVIEAGGCYGTLGYHFRENQQALLRFDALETGRLRADARNFVIGWNLWPTDATEVQVNWIVPAAGRARFEDQRFEANFQVGF